MSLVVSVLVKDVGESGFIVKVSGAPKFKGEDGLFDWVLRKVVLYLSRIARSLGKTRYRVGSKATSRWLPETSTRMK